uniref:PKD_channel domain-containing protein n=1 Tax=Mesocestoides corti TaxID=53468 RepID=A0A5K3F9S6_MESCO
MKRTDSSQREKEEELDDIFSTDLGDDDNIGLRKRSGASILQGQHDKYFACHFGDIKVDGDSAKNDNRFVKVLKDIWDTRNRKTMEDKQTQIKTTVRDLVIHLMFIAVILTIALLPTLFLKTHFFTDITKLLFPPSAPRDKSFSNIKNWPQMWRYIQEDFLEATYTSDSKRLQMNSLVGRPRIRQVRVQSTDCETPDYLQAGLPRCFPNFSPNLESRQPLVPGNNQSTTFSKPAWTWRSASESKLRGVAGTIASYTGSGYYLDLASSRSEAKAMLNELKHGLWVGKSTRAIILDFTLYNANLNFFCVGQILFETPYTGGVIASADFRTMYLLRQHSVAEYVIFVCELTLLAFVIYYVVVDCIKIKKLGLAYFCQFWNLLALGIIALSIACVGLNFYNRIFVRRLLARGIKHYGIYPEFVSIGFISLQYNRVLTLLVFFSLVQIFKYVTFSETMGQLIATLNYALYDMFGFTVMFTIVFAAFAQAGTLMFGQTNPEFKSFDLTAFTLYRIILGDFDIEAIQEAHIVLGPVYFIIYIFFVFFVLLNMFLAIIGEAYAKVKKDMVKRKNDFKFIGYVRHSAKQFLARLSKKKRMPLDKVLDSAGVGDQMELSFGNWRRAMKS